MNASVIGLGKLGSCYAAFFASRGITVVGFDTDRAKIAALNKGLPPVEETDLPAYIRKNRARLRASTSVREAVLASDATFIIVPTPSKKDGLFLTDYAKAACVEIGRALKEKKGYHLVCLVSTVLPGDCRTDLIPALEKASGKACGKDFGFCYNPSLIALGDVIRNLENPDFLFLGAYDKKSGDALAAIYRKVYPALEPERMSLESVELAKIALNSYITMKITFANVLGKLAEKIPQANVDHITRALGKDKRIGHRYLSAGLGYGGPCFPRDNFAFAHMAKKRGVATPLALATHRINSRIPADLASLLHQLGRENDVKTIGFLGVSYKPKTKVTEESQALQIAQLLRKKGYKIHIYEPDASEARRIFGKSASYHASLGDLVKKSDMLFVSNRDASFERLPKLITQEGRCKVILDPWGMFTEESFDRPVLYKALGRS